MALCLCLCLSLSRLVQARDSHFLIPSDLQSRPAVVLYVHLLPTSAIRNAQHDLEGIL
jgi:hypothetical protein